MKSLIDQSVAIIQKHLAEEFNPRIGLILGSGLSGLVEDIQVVARINYHDLPGFFVSSVQGHAGELVLGYLSDQPVVCMSGRVHLYEGATPQDVALPIRVMKQLGVGHLLVTNAAGVLDPNIPSGSIMQIKDQINMTGVSPLTGPNDTAIGPRFVPMDSAYDQATQQIMQQAAESLNIPLPSGVYIGVLGPQFETPAEIRAFKALGADLVGMSTVLEVIAACHCGMKVNGVSAVTNVASGLLDTPIEHDSVLEHGATAGAQLSRLLKTVVPQL